MAFRRVTRLWSSSRRARRAALVVAIFGSVFAPLGLLAHAKADEEPLKVVGTLPMGFTYPSGGVPHPLFIDPTLQIGVTEDPIHSNVSDTLIRVFDLTQRRLVDTLTPPPAFSNGQFGAGNWAAVDTVYHRIFWLQNAVTNHGSCSSPQVLYVLNLSRNLSELTWKTKALPCVQGVAGLENFWADGISYYAPKNKLYVTGQPATTYVRTPGSPGVPQRSAFDILELDPGKPGTPSDGDAFGLGWDVPVNGLVDPMAPCDWHFTSQSDSENSITQVGTVGRSGDNVISWCSRGGDGGQGGQGMALVIPLGTDGQPTKTGGKYDVRTSPTMTGLVSPTVDQASGRILISAQNPPWGPNVWVYDPVVAQGFLGVIKTGASGGSAAYWQGFDPASGRIYVHDHTGFVVVNARGTPLPGGSTSAFLANESPPTNFAPLAVDSAHRRIYVLHANGDKSSYAIVEDHYPDAGNYVDDPDRTADIPEVDGKTDRNFGGVSSAFGIHLLNTSGVPTAVDNLGNSGPLALSGVAVGHVDCGLDPSRCLTSNVVSPGTREGFLSDTSAQIGSGTPTTAFASAGHTSDNDTATSADIKSAGNCESDKVDAALGYNASAANGANGATQSVTGVKNDTPGGAVARQCSTLGLLPDPLQKALTSSPLGGQLATLQQGIQGTLGTLRQGTHHDDGSEFPINGSLCNDSGGSPVPNKDNPGTNSDPSELVGSSQVTCDRDKSTADAKATNAALAIPSVTGASFSIGHSSSESKMELTKDGTVTTVTATASGIEIGPLTIGQVVTTAIAKAHGRTGTTHYEFTRTISGVHGPGIDCGSNCNPKQVVDGINQAGNGSISARIADPGETATPHGYTASVSKRQGQADTDRLLSEDDTLNVTGLDITILNDASFTSLPRLDPNNPGVIANDHAPLGKRSRLIIGLAGVRAESHYGIFPLATGGAGTGGTGATPATPGTPDIPGSEGSEVAIPGTPGSAGQQSTSLGIHLAGSAGRPPVHKHHKPGLLSQLLHGIFHPFEGLKNFWALIISHPFEAVMVFLMLSMLAVPVYLAIRRRELNRVLLSEA